MRALKAIVTLPLLTLAAACEPATSVAGPDVLAVQATRHQGGDDGERSMSSRRSGTLHLEKECSEYQFRAGDFCTITSSTVKWIKVGSKIIYASAGGETSLDSDITLVPPGRGNSRAFGHCTLVYATLTALCRFSGGTGKFRRFRASLAGSHVEGVLWALDGTYSFAGNGNKGDDEDED